MTEEEIHNYIKSCGSYMNDSDPGYICYTALPPEKIEHRDEMVDWLRKTCRPRILKNEDNLYSEGELERIDTSIKYLENLIY